MRRPFSPLFLRCSRKIELPLINCNPVFDFYANDIGNKIK